MTQDRLTWAFGFLVLSACSDSTPPNSTGTATTGSPATTGSGGGAGTTGGSGGNTAGKGGAAGNTTSGGAGGATAGGAGGTGGSGMAGSGTGGGTAGSGTAGAGTAGSAGTGGSAGAGDSGAGGSNDAGSTDGSGAKDSSPGADAVAPGGCSEPGAGPMPPTGFNRITSPMDTKFPFTTHWMGTFSDTSSCVAMTSLTDLDKDGDQDFASGQRDQTSSCGVAGAPTIWWEYCSPDHWVKHTVGTGYQSAAAGGAADFDSDGWIDLVIGDSWFKNPGATIRTSGPWMRYATGAPGRTEEITMGDLNGDGKLDALYVERSLQPQWWTPGANPTSPWILTSLSSYRQQQGGAIGDLDGDGRNDALVGDRWWYKSPGDGGPWVAKEIPAHPAFAPASVNGSEPMTMIGDLDSDGDNDFAVHTHWGGNIAWMENTDGLGTTWAPHMIAPNGGVEAKSNLHGLLIADFDNDGDADMFVAQNQGSVWIYENTGNRAFVEHLVASGPGHDPRVADVDCDGDLDIVGKPWGNPTEPRGELAAPLRAHVYFKNELVERGGMAVFDRPKVEIWNVPNKGRCRP